MILTDVTVKAISVHTPALAQVIYMVILIPIITKVTKITRGFDNLGPRNTLRLPTKLVHGLADTNQTNNCIFARNPEHLGSTMSLRSFHFPNNVIAMQRV
jgi:hypothetical protein